MTMLQRKVAAIKAAYATEAGAGRFEAAHAARMLREANRACDAAHAAEHPCEYSMLDQSYADGWAIGHDLIPDAVAPSGLSEAERRAWDRGRFAGRVAGVRDRQEREYALGWALPDGEGNDHAGTLAGHPADWTAFDYSSEGH
jgi:hypothetical protein